MNHNENPFAYGPENTEMGSRRTFHDYENPFAFQGPEQATTGAGGGATGKSDRNSSYFSANPLRLQRWNTGLRFATFIFCLIAVFLVFFAKQSSSANGLSDLTVKYNIFGSFQFFLYTNLVVCVYAILLTMLALLIGRKGIGETTPASVGWPLFVLNEFAGCFMLLAFAAALSIQVLNSNGYTLYNNGNTQNAYIQYPALCTDFGSFCNQIDAALASSMIAFCCIMASTCIDAYCIHRRNL